MDHDTSPYRGTFCSEHFKKDEPALEIQAIKRLRLRPGDIIVLKSKAVLSANYMEFLSQEMKRQFPDNKTIVLEGDMDIEVLSCEKG